MTIETQSALESGAMESFTKLLAHKTATIRGKAARDVMDLRYIQYVYFTVYNLFLS